MINFAIPGMYELSGLNFKLLQALKQDPQFFYPNIKINAVYGNFQFCIWDGGRIFTKYAQATAEEILRVKNIYNNKFNVPIRFIFTNNCLKPEHFNNRFCNLMLELCEDVQNEIVLVNNDLMLYIQKKYPHYKKFISSTTKCLKTFDAAKAELADTKFFKVCLDYNLNHNLDFLKTFSAAEKEKTELLCNAICPGSCKNRKEHYRLNSIYSLTFGKDYTLPGCGIVYNTLMPNDCNRKTIITINDIFNIYEPMGFKYFKLEGRSLPITEVAGTYVDYFVKPEYKTYVYNALIQSEIK